MPCLSHAGQKTDGLRKIALVAWYWSPQGGWLGLRLSRVIETLFGSGTASTAASRARDAIFESAGVGPGRSAHLLFPCNIRSRMGQLGRNAAAQWAA
jgi:hypothetical protein